jgi:hypothetical protein
MSLGWILSAKLVAMADYLFGLVIEPGMLLSAGVVKTIRPKQHLILSFVIRSSIGPTASGLAVASAPHYQRGLTCGYA